MTNKKHKHHIIPKHMGGTDDKNNIVELLVSDHAVAHLKLYYTHEKYEDLCAYYMLSGKIEKFRSQLGHLGGTACQQKRKEQGLNAYGLEPNSKKAKEISSKGGKIQGARNAASGHMNKIKTKESLSKAGKAAALKNKIRGVGSFFNKDEHVKAAAKGGRIQGLANAASGHLKRISKLSKKNKGQFWITDGIKNKMTKSEIPNGWRKGRTLFEKDKNAKSK